MYAKYRKLSPPKKKDSLSTLRGTGKFTQRKDSFVPFESRNDETRNDDKFTATGNFLRRQLQQMLPGVKTKRFRQLKFENGTVIPVTPDLRPGAASVIQELFETTGEAKIMGPGAWDIPLSNTAMDEDEYNVILVMAGAQFDFRELEAAQLASLPVRQRKLFGARRMIAEKMNKIAAYGSNSDGLTGFFNNANVTATDSTFNHFTATADEIIEYWMDQVASVVESTNLVEKPNTAVVSEAIHRALYRKRLPDGDKSVKQYLIENHPYLRNFVNCVEAQEAKLQEQGIGVAGKDRITLLTPDPEMIERHIETVKALPEEYRKGKYEVNLYSCTTEVIVHYPGSMLYLDVPNS